MKTNMGAAKIKTTTIDLAQEETVAKEPKTIKKAKVRGKKYKENKAQVDRNKFYSLLDAISLIKKISYSKFDGTVELHLVTKKAGISANVTLPHSTGKVKRIEVADEATLEKLKTGKIDFDVLLATAEMMPKLVAFAKLLGPRGLMPNPKTGTLLKSVTDAKKFSADTLTVKTEKKAPVIHTTAGKVSMEEKAIKENIEAIFKAVGKTQILKAYIKPTMGPSVKIALG